jgi:hypothetical protein
MCLEQADEFFERVRGMPNRQHGERSFCVGATFYYLPTGLDFGFGRSHPDFSKFTGALLL